MHAHSWDLNDLIMHNEVIFISYVCCQKFFFLLTSNKVNDAMNENEWIKYKMIWQQFNNVKLNVKRYEPLGGSWISRIEINLLCLTAVPVCRGLEYGCQVSDRN